MRFKGGIKHGTKEHVEKLLSGAVGGVGETQCTLQTVSDAAKTERECVNLTRKMAEEQGYQDLNKLVENNTALKAGDKVYAECMGKTIVLFQIGKEPLEKGMNILGAHVDAPRLDVKQNPLYEDSELAYLDTHYYGGIKKYQWVTIPLALHGVFAKKDGTVREITIGEKADDPVFVISDLLIHISQEQPLRRRLLL